MTCQQCQCVWCYCCGLDTASDECDKATPEEAEFGMESSPEYLHNVQWYSSELRCPMYLNQINELDPAWPGADSDTTPLEHFHRQRTLRLLRAVVDEMGVEQYDALAAAYPGRCGAAAASRSRRSSTWRPMRRSTSAPMSLIHSRRRRTLLRSLRSGA